MKNIRTLDRYLRLIIGTVLLELAYFWLGAPWSWAAYMLAAVAIGTALVGYCPLYRLLGIAGRKPSGPAVGMTGTVIAVVILATLAVGGSYASALVTRKMFLADFNAMNAYYKQTLFLTGKGERAQANVNYAHLVPAFDAFQTRYTRSQPYALKGDVRLAADLQSVSDLLSQVGPTVRNGDLHQAHLELEKVRPIFQDLFKRNGFSMLSVALVDFHDAMELMLDAAHAKDAGKITALYPSVSDKLKAIEAEAGDDPIKAIRNNLDNLNSLAAAPDKTDDLPAQAETLKSSFIKVYLERG